jgi:hypothetical protein
VSTISILINKKCPYEDVRRNSQHRYLKMLKHLIRLSAIVFGLFTLSAEAQSVKITQVTNYQTATNGCTVNSAAGGYNFVVWGVSCPSENGKIVYVQTTYGNYGSCTASTYTSGYTTSSNCTSYSVYRTTAVVTPPPPPVCTTTNINIGQTCNGDYWCAESFGRACSAAGGSTASTPGGYVCQKTTCVNP